MVLKLKTTEAPEKNQKVICELVMDEIYIRQHIKFNNNNKKYSGYVNFGYDFDESEGVVAREALVFLLTGKFQWHFFCNWLKF